MGAGLFITTVVIATVLLVTKGRNYNIGYYCSLNEYWNNNIMVYYYY